jgi:LacI family transcriptional regulator
MSISTVSKSLRNSPEIGEDTRKEITRRSFTITDLTCPKFKNRKTKAIGIIIRRLFIFFSTVINGIEQVANEKNSVIICLSDDSFDKEVLNMEMLANGS